MSDLHLWMVRSYTKPNEAKGHRQLLVHVHPRLRKVPHHLLGRVEAGWS
jgi:hypothetical protein